MPPCSMKGLNESGRSERTQVPPAETIAPDAPVRAGPWQPEVQGGVEVCANNVVGMGTHVLGADDDDDGAIVSGIAPITATQSHDGQEEAPPPEADAPEASTRVSFAGGVHLHINTQREQASMASWLTRGYEGRLCKLLVDMGVTEEEISTQAPMDMIGVLSCRPNSFGRHTSLLVDRAGSILQALARMGLPVLNPPPFPSIGGGGAAFYSPSPLRPRFEVVDWRSACRGWPPVGWAGSGGWRRPMRQADGSVGGLSTRLDSCDRVALSQVIHACVTVGVCATTLCIWGPVRIPRCLSRVSCRAVSRVSIVRVKAVSGVPTMSHINRLLAN